MQDSKFEGAFSELPIHNGISNWPQKKFVISKPTIKQANPTYYICKKCIPS